MAKEKFIDYKFSPDKEILVDRAEQITDQYRRQGYELSVRQLFYQMVSTNVLANTTRNYQMLVELITNARMAGRIDWHSIVDRNRQTNDYRYFADLAECLRAASKDFRVNKWLKQPNYVEFMVEKASLEGVIQRPCSKHQIPFTAARGYPSSTLMYDMAHRMRERTLVGHKTCHVIYCGDLDPSGVDIDRDIRERLNSMSGVSVYVHRVALNKTQVEQYQCPPNPAKMSDSRAEAYVAEHGMSSWEVDSLNPSILGDLVENAIVILKDPALWRKELEREAEMKERLQDIIDEESGD